MPKSTHRSLSALVFASIALFSSTGAAAPLFSRPGTGPVVEVQTDVARDLAALPRATTVDLPLADGGTARFALRPIEVFAPGARVVEQGAGWQRVIPRPDVVVYEGEDVATPGRSLALSITNGTKITALIRDGRRVVTLVRPSPLGARAHALVDPTGSLPPSGQARCKVDGFGDLPGAPGPDLPPTPGDGKETLAIEMLVDVAYDAYAYSFGWDSAVTTEYAAGLFGAVSAIYRRDVNVAVLIGQLVIWTEADPFPGEETSEQLDAYRGWDLGNRADVPRDTAMLLGIIPYGGGLGYVRALCDDRSYSVANIDADAATFPTTGFLWDVDVVAHELGHNTGSKHTHCYHPPLDHCYVEPGCYPGPAEVGTGETMSYCHLNGNVELGFGDVVGQVLRAFAENAFCVEAAPGVCGDGVVDPGEQCDNAQAPGGCCAASCTATPDLPCDDGNPCTEDDVCQEEICVGKAVICKPKDVCHQAGTCDPASGLCDDPTVPDGNACYPNGVCEAGECRPRDEVEEGGGSPTGSRKVISVGTCVCMQGSSRDDGLLPLGLVGAALLVATGRRRWRGPRRERSS